MEIWIWLLLIFCYGCGWLSILMWAFIAKKLRESDLDYNQFNSLTLACGGIWIAAMLLAPTPKYFQSLQPGYQLARR